MSRDIVQKVAKEYHPLMTNIENQSQNSLTLES